MSECFVWVLIYIPDSGEELGGTGYRRLSGDSRKVSFIRSIPGGLIDIEGDGGVYIVLMMFGVCGEIVVGVLG